MRHLKAFEEYLRLKIAKKQASDVNRARSLREEAQEGYEILYSYLIDNEPSDKNANHIIKNAYDIIMELVRAEMSSQGFWSSGRGAHEAEVAFMQKLGFSDTEVSFADSLRNFRNGILYYGEKYDAEYARKVLSFLKKVMERLKEKT